MFSTRRSCFRPCLVFLRNAHVQSAEEINHYKTLGLTPSASKEEIKSAYYELSKKHHPDRNKGSEESAKIFRLVRAAYEVLGNEQSRMQYDKTRIFKVVRKTVTYPTDSGPDYKDDAERKHFHSRARAPFKRNSYGKTAYYNFDAWYDNHYGPQSKYEFFYKEPRQFKESTHEEVSEKQMQFFRSVKSKLIVLFYTVILVTSISVQNKKIKDSPNYHTLEIEDKLMECSALLRSFLYYDFISLRHERFLHLKSNILTFEYILCYFLIFKILNVVVC